MGLSDLIGILLPGARPEPPKEPLPVSVEGESRRESDREMEGLVREVIRGRLAAGEAAVIGRDPDLGEHIAAEMGVTIPAAALEEARRALAERRRVLDSEAAELPAGGYPLAGYYDSERFRSLGHEAAAVLQRFARYGDDYAGEHRDGKRLLAIAGKISYGGTIQEWSPGSRLGPTALMDPDYPRPELAWLPGYLLRIGRDMVRNAEPHLRASR